MRPLKRILMICCIISSPFLMNAQQGQKMHSPLPNLEDIYANDCQKCDSLGEAYLLDGDTSMALYYFNLFLDANPHHDETRSDAQKFKKLYSKYSNSFYLKEY